MKKAALFLAIVIAVISTAGNTFAQEGAAQKTAPQAVQPPSPISQQDIEKFRIMEDSLLVTADSMYNAFIPDARIGYSERLVRQLVRTLRIPNSYLYRFDTLGKLLNIIYSDDNAFRIFNWGVEPNNISKRYYGAIQLPGEKLRLIGLNDYAEQMEKGAEDSILTGGKWFGGLYYRIIPRSVNGKTVYTLFGLNSGNPLMNRKFLDALTFDGKGVTFGAPIFGVVSMNFPQQRVNRFILEYKKSVQASMNWDSERKMIVFDKLMSEVNDPHRKYTYVPSGQYDGFDWENETWTYIRDLIPIQVLKDGEAPTESPK
jgi:hypothetical protein